MKCIRLTCLSFILFTVLVSIDIYGQQSAFSSSNPKKNNQNRNLDTPADLITGIEVSWHQIAVPEPLPQPRGWASAIYDPIEDRMILFGGWSHEGYNSRNDTWSFDLSSHIWTQLFPTEGPPSNRGGHTAIYDSQR